MENIILTNNKDLRLVGVKVGVLSTLRFELPLVSASAMRVEVIVTSGNVHSAYTATFIDSTKRWQCDIAASQFPAVGRQSYEIAYLLDGKQFWDGKGWIEIEDATTSGIEPQPRPEPYRYAVVSVNGYGADAQGAVRIPKTFIATDSPTTTDGFMEGDIYFNRLTGATWTLCNVQGTLTWVFNYSNYYTKAETDEQIDKLAAYYITSDVQGNPFATHAALVNAQTYYSGGVARVPTRNDYTVVLADESHGGAEWRYIYAVAAGQATGQWEAQYPVEGVMTVDPTVTRGSQNPVAGGGIWSAIWGALTALPTGFSSLYDWCVNQLAGKQDVLTAQQLANIAAVPDKLDKSGGTADNLLICGANEAIKFDDDFLYIYRKINGAWVAQNVWDLRTSQDGIVAFLSDIYDAVQQIAPAFTAKTYAANDLCTYDGAVYRCKMGYTATASSAKPGADTTHWEAKPVSKLFLPLTGGTMTGRLDIEYLNSTGEVYFLAFAAGDAPYTLLLGFDGSRYFFFVGSAKVYLPVNAGTLALAAANPTTGNLAAVDASGNPVDSGIPKTSVATKPSNPTAGNLVKTTAAGELQDAGYHFEVRNGIPCIVQYT